MRLLTINSFDCSAQSSGGVNQTTVALTTYFTRQCGIRCYLGFFEYLPVGQEPLPLFEDRILLNCRFDREAFAAFLQKHRIDIVQVNFLKKHNLVVMPQLYEVAHQCGAKVIYAFHMCPGFQIHTYGSWQRTSYGWLHRDNALAETKKWLLTATRKLWLPIARKNLQGKYLTPYNSADKVVVLSQYYFASYCYYAGVEQSDKMVAIGNSLRFAEYATEKDIALKEKTVIVVARFDEDTKRISLVLKAWRRIEADARYGGWKLQLVGTGRDLPFYQYLVQKWRLSRVEFTGLQNPQEYYRKASLFLMTSTAEGWPMVLLEAQQMGVPVIAMDSFGSLHDMVTDGVNGCIVANNDLPAFTQAMTGLMTNEALRRKYATAAIESCRRYEIAQTAVKWQALFDELMQDKK